LLCDPRQDGEYSPLRWSNDFHRRPLNFERRGPGLDSIDTQSVPWFRLRPRTSSVRFRKHFDVALGLDEGALFLNFDGVEVTELSGEVEIAGVSIDASYLEVIVNEVVQAALGDLPPEQLLSSVTNLTEINDLAFSLVLNAVRSNSAYTTLGIDLRAE
jgi:hypothetical protein